MPLKLSPTTPKKSLNAVFLKVRPLRSEIDNKANLINLLVKVDESEWEGNQKTPVHDFLVIYNIEKRPTNEFKIEVLGNQFVFGLYRMQEDQIRIMEWT
jgi:hypothetical protein